MARAESSPSTIANRIDGKDLQDGDKVQKGEIHHSTPVLISKQRDCEVCQVRRAETDPGEVAEDEKEDRDVEDDCDPFSLLLAENEVPLQYFDGVVLVGFSAAPL